MTSTQEFAAVVLAAGKGTRMRSAQPKVLHPVAGRPMIGHVLAAVQALGPARLAVVVAPGMQAVTDAVAPVRTAVQIEARGTADAVKAALDELFGFAGTVMVLFGDTPLISGDTLARMLAARAAAGDPAVVVLGFRPADPARYGRLILGAGGDLERIVEAADLSGAEAATDLCNSGVMAIDGRVLARYLAAIGNANAKGEYYLTDIVAVARADGRHVAVVEADAVETMGVDSRAGLARAEAAMQARLRAAAMEAGVTLVDPTSVHLSFDTRLAPDVTVEPQVWFGPGVSVEAGAQIKGFSHIEGAHVGAGATVGPFARLRPGAALGAKAKIGNFVEVKSAAIGAGAKISHLSYVGDAEIGADANLGAGTITCNYDGYLKHRTVVGRGAFVGSNTALVAPVTVGEGAIVGAGSTITRDVPADALAVARGRQTEIEQYAPRFRAERAARKAQGQAHGQAGGSGGGKEG
ncbi:MAG: bifunctional UDP-N-acetylglucosamine diphosphorylase/glucosamine-1-phosphate N-acetyltransferase GlmU [Alphaproteobacteria bacterium]